MNAADGLGRVRFSAWVLPFLAIAFVASHVILFYVWWHGGPVRGLIPDAIVCGALFLITVKHVGLLAAVFRPLYNLFHRRSPK